MPFIIVSSEGDTVRLVADNVFARQTDAIESISSALAAGVLERGEAFLLLDMDRAVPVAFVEVSRAVEDEILEEVELEELPLVDELTLPTIEVSEEAIAEARAESSDELLEAEATALTEGVDILDLIADAAPEPEAEQPVEVDVAEELEVTEEPEVVEALDVQLEPEREPELGEALEGELDPEAGLVVPIVDLPEVELPDLPDIEPPATDEAVSESTSIALAELLDGSRADVELSEIDDAELVAVEEDSDSRTTEEPNAGVEAVVEVTTTPEPEAQADEEASLLEAVDESPAWPWRADDPVAEEEDVAEGSTELDQMPGEADVQEETDEAAFETIRDEKIVAEVDAQAEPVEETYEAGAEQPIEDTASPVEALEADSAENEAMAVEEAEVIVEAEAVVAAMEDDACLADAPGYEAGECDLSHLTCTDCVYVNTCPNKEERTPSTCGSFQWTSV